MHSPHSVLGRARTQQQPLLCPHWTHRISSHQVDQLTHARCLKNKYSHKFTAAVAASGAPALTPAVGPHAEHSSSKQSQSKHSRPPKQYKGRLVFRQEHPDFNELPASLSQLRQPGPYSSTAQQQWHQHPQQQPPQRDQQQHPHIALPTESLRNRNMRFSTSLKQLQSLSDWLDLLQGSSNISWGVGLCDLDGVSVVGALVWLVKSREWRQGQQKWNLSTRQAVQQAVEMLLDRASELVIQDHSSSNSSSQQPQAAAAGGGLSSIPLMRPAELAAVIYCSSKLGQHRPQLLASAAAALSRDLYACSTVELNRLIWGLATARVHPGDPWLLSFCKASQAKFFMSEPAHLSMMVYGLARLGYRPPDLWIPAWLEASEPMLAQFSAQNLTNAAWGLSCWRFQAPSHWLDALYTATSTAMSQMEPGGISQLQLALVTLGAGQPPPTQWIQSMMGTAEQLFPKMELLQLCNFGWGLAQWRYKPPVEVMQRYLGAVQPLLVGATPIDLSILLWICDKLSFMPQQSWLDSWFASATASLPRFEPQHLTTITLVLGQWGLVPGPAFSIDFFRCIKSRAKDFTSYQLGLLLWGLGMTQQSVPNTWATALLSTCTEHLLPEAEPSDVCRLIGGLASVVVKPKGSKTWVTSNPEVEEQLQGLCAWVLPQLGQLEPSWLLVLFKGLDRLGLVLSKDTIRGFTAAAARFDERLDLQQRKFLLGVLQNMRRRAGSAAGREGSSSDSSSSSLIQESSAGYDITWHAGQQQQDLKLSSLLPGTPQTTAGSSA